MENIKINLHHRVFSHPLPEIRHALAKAKPINQSHAGQQNPRNRGEENRSRLSLP